ncbi:hypothetical protein Tco_0607118 [Tanacetum coccineum]
MRGRRHGVGIPAVSDLENTVVKTAHVQPKRQRKRKTIVSDAGEPSHPPKKLREDYKTSTGPSVAGKSRFVLQKLLAGAVLNPEAGIAALPTLPFITSFVSVTLERESKDQTDSMAGANLRTITAPPRKFVESSIFGGDSSGGGADHTVGGFSDLTGSDFLVGGIRIVISPDVDLQKVYAPQWSVTNGSRLDDGRTCREMVDEFAPPKFFASIRGMDHDQLFTEFNVGAARQMSLSAEVRMGKPKGTLRYLSLVTVSPFCRMRLSNDPLLSRVNTLGSGEDSMKLMELMEHCTTLSELVKTVNGERQLQAVVDKKKVIITETSIISDLNLEDAGGTDCFCQLLPMILKELAMMGKQRKDNAPTKPTTEETTPEENVATPSCDPPQSVESLKRRVKSLEKRRKSRTPGFKRLRKVGSASRVESSNDVSLEQEKDVAEKEVSAADPVTTASEIVTTANVEVTTVNALTTTIDELTLAQTLISTRPKAKGIVFHDQEEQASAFTPIVSSSQLPQAKDKGKGKMVKPEKPLKKKDQIALDEELALRLHAEEQAEFEKERVTQEEASRTAIIDKLDSIQAMIEADEQLAARLQAKEQE